MSDHSLIERKRFHMVEKWALGETSQADPRSAPWARAHAASAKLRRALVMPGSAHGKAARISAPILGVGLIGKARAHLAVEPMFAMLLELG